MVSNALILQAKGRISHPLPGTPNIPSIHAGVLFDWDPESLPGADGQIITSLRSVRGTLGRAGDLSVVTSGTVTVSEEEGRKKSIRLGSGSLATDYFDAPLTAPLTIAIVAGGATPTHESRYLLSGGVGGYTGITFTGIGFSQLPNVNFGASAGVNEPVALLSIFNGDNSQTTVNGGSRVTGKTGTASSVAPRFILGANSSAADTSRPTGRVYRVIAYNRVLSAKEQSLLQSYLAAEYGL